MITAICGKTGTGKTALMTKLGIEYMVGERGQVRLKESRAMTKYLNRVGYFFSLPKRHVVYADYNVTAKREYYSRRKSYELDGWRLGLDKPNMYTAVLPPHSVICLDEVQRYYNSRRKDGIPDNVSRFYETHRHYGYDIFLVAQRPVLIDKNIRGLVESFIFIDRMSHKYDSENRLVKTTWQCKEFDSTESAERYSDSGEGKCRVTKYSYKGNIFRCYNHKSFLQFHLKGKYDKDFEYNHFNDVGNTPTAVEQYNLDHSYVAPQGYYDSKRS